jgi:hypothetical protein
MPHLSSIDAISPAFERLATMLFQPFRFKTWLEMGFIGWLAGVASTGGMNLNYQVPSLPPKEGSDAAGEFDRILRTLFSEHLWLILVLAALGVALLLVFTYLFCRFRFILFDAVLTGSPGITRAWNRYSGPAHRYLGFWLLFLLISWIVLSLIVGLPLWRAYKAGIFQSPDPFSSVFRVLAPILLGALAFALVSAIVSSLANDFVVPQLALEDVRMETAWANLTKMISAEPGAFAAYLGMKLLLSIAAGILTAVALVFAFVIVLIPGALATVLVAAIVKAMGTAGLIFGVIMAGVGILALMGVALILSLMVVAPAAVFFAAYSLQFFGGRYPKLGEQLWPHPAPASPSPYAGGTPPPPMPGPA